MLCFAGYDPIHAAALAAGPAEEVDALWRAAGSPGDTILERMASDAVVVRGLCSDLPA